MFLACLIAPVAEELSAALREDLPSRRDSETTFFLKASTFRYLGSRQRAREEQVSGAVILLLGANGKDVYVVKGWKGIKKQRNKKRN